MYGVIQRSVVRGNKEAERVGWSGGVQELRES